MQQRRGGEGRKGKRENSNANWRRVRAKMTEVSGKGKRGMKAIRKQYLQGDESRRKIKSYENYRAN
jgi:hypothetical protein